MIDPERITKNERGSALSFFTEMSRSEKTNLQDNHGTTQCEKIVGKSGKESRNTKLYTKKIVIF